jgi:hypothetical protein
MDDLAVIRFVAMDNISMKSISRGCLLKKRINIRMRTNAASVTPGETDGTAT